MTVDASLFALLLPLLVAAPPQPEPSGLLPPASVVFVARTVGLEPSRDARTVLSFVVVKTLRADGEVPGERAFTIEVRLADPLSTQLRPATFWESQSPVPGDEYLFFGGGPAASGWRALASEATGVLSLRADPSPLPDVELVLAADRVTPPERPGVVRSGFRDAAGRGGGLRARLLVVVAFEAGSADRAELLGLAARLGDGALGPSGVDELLRALQEENEVRDRPRDGLEAMASALVAALLPEATGEAADSSARQDVVFRYRLTALLRDPAGREAFARAAAGERRPAVLRALESAPARGQLSAEAEAALKQALAALSIHQPTKKGSPGPSKPE